MVVVRRLVGPFTQKVGVALALAALVPAIEGSEEEADQEDGEPREDVTVVERDRLVELDRLLDISP